MIPSLLPLTICYLAKPNLEFQFWKPLKLLACRPNLNQQASSEVKILACGSILGNSLSEPAGTISDVLALFMKGKPEPQILQKDLENALVECSYVVMLPSPLSHSMFPGSVKILDENTEPVSCWHCLQWHW